ncbi:Uncharacterized protein TCM_028269 [Theobroma cacao]|uniref:Secreted protein n=1 Tax=Theobroma cacao TaxID=3641 RepID=A0A061GAP0_THECC|nr:Uncharacterized protein TCM_028269 [Theobroma cacao]
MCNVGVHMTVIVVCCVSAHTDGICHAWFESAHDSYSGCGSAQADSSYVRCGSAHELVRWEFEIHSRCGKKLSSARSLTSLDFRCSKNAFSPQRETLE